MKFNAEDAPKPGSDEDAHDEGIRGHLVMAGLRSTSVWHRGLLILGYGSLIANFVNFWNRPVVLIMAAAVTVFVSVFAYYDLKTRGRKALASQLMAAMSRVLEN